jgi:hypothetical protein
MVALEDREEYMRLWEQLEALWDAGQGESDEAEVIRVQMDTPWKRLTPADLDALRAYWRGRESAS